MTDTPPTTRTPGRRPYKIRGPETWALIRESYLAGAPAKVLAARYDVTEWAIWRRAWREGWTKQDRVEGAPAPAVGPLIPALPAGADAGDPRELARAALRGVGEAMRQGRLDEARQLAQLAESLGRCAEKGSQTNLEMVARALLEPGYAMSLMDVRDDPAPDPVKQRYWEEVGRRRQAAEKARLAALKPERGDRAQGA